MKIKFNEMKVQAVYFRDLAPGCAFTYIYGPDTYPSLFMKTGNNEAVNLENGITVGFGNASQVYPHAQAIVEAGPVTMEKKW